MELKPALLQGERLPAAIVDLDAFDRNAALLARIAGDGSKTLRLATKSLRVPALISRALRRGHPYRGLMCYSAEEAVFLASQGLDDLLVAYPTVQDSDLRMLAGLHAQGREVRVVIDSLEHVQALSRHLDGAAKPFPVVLELDVSLRLFGGRAHLGVRRSPLRTIRDALDLAEAIGRDHPRVQVAGAMAYEAQVAGLGDRNPFQPLLNIPKRWIRRLSARSVRRARERLAGAFKRSGMPLGLFNGGGSGSADFAAGEPWLTEFSAGSGLLAPHLFDYYSNIRFEPACFFALQAVRRSDADFITCQGGGYIASGEPGWDRVPLPVAPAGARLTGMEGCGEVQTPLRLPSGASVGLGDPVFFRHAKAGELAERFNEYLLVSQGRVVSRAKTYRGFGMCFF